MSDLGTDNSIENIDRMMRAATEHDDLTLNDLEDDYEVAEGNEVVNDEMPTGEMCSSLLTIGFAILADKRGPHWVLSEREAIESGNALGAVLDKYFPDMKHHGAEVAAVMACVMVVTPRIAMDKAIAKEAGIKTVTESKREEKPETTAAERVDNGAE